MAAVAARQLLAQLLVVPADDQRRVVARTRDRVERLGHVANAPGSGDDEDQTLLVVEAERLAGGAPVGEVAVEALGDHGPRRRSGPARSCGSRRRRLGVHAQVEVNARMRPEGMHGEVGEEDADAPLLPGAAKHQGGHGIGGDDDVGFRLACPAQKLAAGQEVDQNAERLDEEGESIPEAVGRVVGPRRIAELEPVPEAHEPARAQRKRIEEVDHLGVMAPVT